MKSLRSSITIWTIYLVANSNCAVDALGLTESPPAARSVGGIGIPNGVAFPSIRQRNPIAPLLSRYDGTDRATTETRSSRWKDLNTSLRWSACQRIDRSSLEGSGSTSANTRKLKIIARCLIASLIISKLLRPSSALAITDAATWSLTPPQVAPVTVSIPIHAAPLGSFKILPTAAELEITFRLFVASFFGGLIGLERSTSDRPAGVRTMALVSLGACAFTLCSIYGFGPFAAMFGPECKYDPSRMASNVASGVGFIGAGVITNNRKPSGVYDKESSVHGLTTAAAIWVSAAVGVASGAGLYFVSGVSALSTIIILGFGKIKKNQNGERNLSVAKKPKKTTTSEPIKPTNTTSPIASTAPSITSIKDSIKDIEQDLELIEAKQSFHNNTDRIPSTPSQTTISKVKVTKDAGLPPPSKSKKETASQSKPKIEPATVDTLGKTVANPLVEKNLRTDASSSSSTAKPPSTAAKEEVKTTAANEEGKTTPAPDKKPRQKSAPDPLFEKYLRSEVSSPSASSSSPAKTSPPKIKKETLQGSNAREEESEIKNGDTGVPPDIVDAVSKPETATIVTGSRPNAVVASDDDTSLP